MDRRMERMEAIIEEGKRNVGSTIKSIMEECEKRKDMRVSPNSIDYKVDDGEILPMIRGNDRHLISPATYNLTDHSRRQMLDRVGIPSTFVDRLMELDEEELLINNLRRLTAKRLSEGILLRTVDNTIKGWLSPAYRRMDSAPIFEAFLNKIGQTDMVPYQGRNSDYRYQIKFVRPHVYNPFKDEFILFGLSLTTGDYGSAALELCMMIVRITCLNLAEGLDLFRRIHLGSRFQMQESDDIIELSQQTYELDGKTVASAIGDCVGAFDSNIKLLEDKISKASEKDINSGYLLAQLKKKFSKEVSERIKTMWESEMPVEILPKEKNLWRFANTISYVAHSIDNLDTKTDLERHAMDLLIN